MCLAYLTMLHSCLLGALTKFDKGLGYGRVMGSNRGSVDALSAPGTSTNLWPLKGSVDVKSLISLAAFFVLARDLPRPSLGQLFDLLVDSSAFPLVCLVVP